MADESKRVYGRRMGMGARILSVVAFLLAASSASGEPDAGVGCPKLVERDKVLKMVAMAADLIKLVSSQTLQSKRDLTTMKETVAMLASKLPFLKCQEPSLSGKELADLQAFEARAQTWTTSEAALFDAEEKARLETIVPLCEALWTIDDARAEITREKSNPSGVVDLHELHVAGEAIQNAQEKVARLRPRYLAFRHHAFSDWHSEGACVAASTRTE